MSFPHRLGRDSVASLPSEFELDRFLLGELSPSSTEILRAHVGACAACRNRRSARDVAFFSFSKAADRIDGRPHSSEMSSWTQPEVKRCDRASCALVPSVVLSVPKALVSWAVSRRSRLPCLIGRSVLPG